MHASTLLGEVHIALLRERYDQQPHTPHLLFEKIGVTVRVGAYRAGGPVSYGNRPDTAANRNARYSGHGRLNRADRQNAWMVTALIPNVDRLDKTVGGYFSDSWRTLPRSTHDCTQESGDRGYRRPAPHRA